MVKTHISRGWTVLIAVLLCILMLFTFDAASRAAGTIQADGLLHEGGEVRYYAEGLGADAAWELSGADVPLPDPLPDGSIRLKGIPALDGATLTASGSTGAVSTIVLTVEPHALQEQAGTDPGCTSEGVLAHYACSICGMLFLDAHGEEQTSPDSLRIGCLEHTLRHIPAKTPTAEEDGRKEHWACTICAGTFLDEAGKEPASEADLFLSRTSHAYAVIVHEPSCEERGYTEYICSDCGETRRDSETDPLGHAPAYVTGSAPSEMLPGTKPHYACLRCGKLFADSLGQTPLTEEDLRIDPTGHDDVLTTAGPDCTNPGTITRTCRLCGDVRTEETAPALGHTLEYLGERAPTASEAGNTACWRCTRCGRYYRDESGEKELSESEVRLEPLGGSSVPTGDPQSAPGAAAVSVLCACAAGALCMFIRRKGKVHAGA